MRRRKNEREREVDADADAEPLGGNGTNVRVRSPALADRQAERRSQLRAESERVKRAGNDAAAAARRTCGPGVR